MPKPSLQEQQGHLIQGQGSSELPFNFSYSFLMSIGKAVLIVKFIYGPNKALMLIPGTNL